MDAEAESVARQALDAGRPEEALEALRPLLARDATPGVLRLAAEAAVEADSADAVHLSRQLLAADPGSAVAHRWLGEALLAEGELESAEAAFRAAIGLDPGDAVAAAALGHLTHRRGHDAEAVALLERAADADPDDTAVVRNLVDLHRLAGRGQQALRWAERLVDRAPDDPLHLLDLATLQLELGEHAAARESFARLLHVDDEPGRAIFAHHGMVEAELRAGHTRAALDLAVTATAVDRNALTTEVLAAVVATVFGPGQRPAPTIGDILTALAVERAAYRQALEKAEVG